MTIRRVALIYDNRARPETTGEYCRRALRGLVDVEHFLPDQLDRVPRQGVDLYLRVDDGLDYRLPSDLRPCAWWVIDTHLTFERDRERAADYDLVFAAQRDGAEGLRREGVATAVWLPLACDPDVHAKHAVEKVHDLCFVGNVLAGPRADLLRLLQKHYPAIFVGRCYFEEMARTYSASRVVFNRSVCNDLNMRVFEALACGSLLLTNDLRDNGQAELFQDGTHLAAYRDPEELLDKARFYLAREAIREQIAAAGRAEALARHTYRHRMERLLTEAGRALAATTATVREELPPAPTEVPAERGTPLGPDRSYFDFPRPELLALIPVGARRVLDVGCGTGRLGETLRARQPAEVVGVELDPEAAGAARGRLDRVLCGDIEGPDMSFGPGTFDAVVCGDILEHLRDPGALLRRIREWLTPDGRLVASIPNVRHHTVVRGLLEGNWTYEAAGLLDRTHLRFFTLRSIGRLFADCGYAVEGTRAVLGPGDEAPARTAPAGVVRVGRLLLEGLDPAEAAEFFTYQYLVTAVPVPAAAPAAANPISHEAPGPAPAAVGCVLAVRDRPIDCLERALQTYTYQTLRPLDLVLLDYGSTPAAAAAYRRLCARYGWRYVAAPTAPAEWHPADAYNRAVASLVPAVEVVFKSDPDVLLGEDVLAAAAALGRERLCVFSPLAAGPGMRYPDRLACHHDLAALLGADPPPAPAQSEGVLAFPRRWFERAGGFDLAYRDGGYEDSDLRLRADWSVGVARAAAPLLIRQGPAAGAPHPRAAHNRAYYESTKAARQVARNRGAADGAPAPPAGGVHPAPRPMRFTQDFVTDFDQFDFFGAPFAFARFGDGERAICTGRPVAAADGWSYDGAATAFAADLNAALRFSAPDYYVGISDGCCDRESRDWFLERLAVPLAQVTFANIFVNGNYPRFRRLDLTRAAVVSCHGGDFAVPEDILGSRFDLDALVGRLLEVDRTILVSAGPASAVIVHKYWTRAARKQVIVDVGSAIDEVTKGRQTRRYQVPGTRTYGLICTW